MFLSLRMVRFVNGVKNEHSDIKHFSCDDKHGPKKKVLALTQSLEIKLS